MSARGIIAACVLAAWTFLALTTWQGRARDIMAAIVIVALAVGIGVTASRAAFRWLTRRFGK